MPTDQSTGKRRESTTIERVTIIEMSAQGFSQRDIQRRIGISKTTVQRVLKNWKSQQIQSLPRTGRPKILNLRDKRRLYRLSDSHPYASLAELRVESGLQVSAETVGRVLRASGRRVRWARHKPHILLAGRRKRMAWSRTQRHITAKQWRRQIFTDEIHVELSPRGVFINVSCQDSY